jgi:cell division protease FtsH
MADKMQLTNLLSRPELAASSMTDAAAARERVRQRRLWKLFLAIALPTFFLWYRIADGRPFNIFSLPSFGPEIGAYIPLILITFVIVAVMVVPMMGAGRSPHMTYAPEQIDISFDDVRGIDPVKHEVIRSLNLFLAHETFRSTMGGTPRRGLLFEGPPGTGKTHLAKAMAREAGVPFLFVSGPAFQSMWYGMTARKIRRFFKTVRKTARTQGGCIAFIEEIDAFATRRSGLEGATPAQGVVNGMRTDKSMSEGTGGTVNELLIQMQSFDEPAPMQRAANRCKDALNAFLPPNRRLKKAQPGYSNVLVIAATNRGDLLDPALLRPGRFDRRLQFDLPSRAGRRELIELFLGRKAHDPELSTPQRIEEVAAMTFGSSPVVLERLFDEALIVALRDGRDKMTLADIQEAKLSIELGLATPAAYTEAERFRIATHEAGHAVCAHLAGVGRKLEILSIIKRKDALGLLGHSESEERFTKTRSELEGLLVTSMGGMVAEELFCGESSTGPAGDLAHATQVAAEMVGSLGLGGSLASFRAAEAGPFDPGLVGRVLGDRASREALEQVLVDAKSRAHQLLTANSHLVARLRAVLLDREELLGEEIVAILDRDTAE